VYGHLQVLSTIFCEEISISSLVGGGFVKTQNTYYIWHTRGKTTWKKKCTSYYSGK